VYTAITGFAAAVCAAAVLFLLRERSALRRRLLDAEMRGLRTQLNPHFLYNTLNAISELGYDSPELADRMVTRLSGLLRKSLDESHRQEIALRDEIDFLKRYLEIQQMLLRDRLSVTFAIDENTQCARVPGMILQPLVENGLTHGAGSDGVAHLDIRAKREGTALIIAVEDHGPGAEAHHVSPGGIGLSNIRARLHHLYGGAGGLELQARTGGGLTAQLKIPFHEAFAYDEAARTDR
jgi:LytS/YehU family sensor histidine kinase